MSSTVTGPADIFGLAGVLWPAIGGQALTPQFETVIGALSNEPVVCLNQTLIQPNTSIDEIDQTDLVIISAADLGSLEHGADRLVPWLKRHYENGATIASVCTGAFLLAETGLLDGRRATTHWGFVDAFRSRYPAVHLMPERLITDEGRLLCGGGAHSYFDLCLYLVNRFCGAEVAAQCARALLLEMRPNAQSPYARLVQQKDHADRPILESQRILEQRYVQGISVEDLAQHVSMSPRNFKRRFRLATGQTPLHYLQCFRIEVAKASLESSDESIENIASQVGYADVSFFRRTFRKFTGVNPGDYRRKFHSSNLQQP